MVKVALIPFSNWGQTTMGDRANVLIRPMGVWLYCHSWGEEIPYLVRDALRSWRDRWNDPGQLASIVFCAMVDRYRHFHDYPIHFSIESSRVVPDHPDLVLDVDTQSASFEEHEIQPRGVLWRDSFAAYAALHDDELRELLARIRYGDDSLAIREWVPTKDLK